MESLSFFRGAPIGKGALVCGKGNHCAGARIARVRVSAHTVWMWSSFPPLRKLQLNHMLPPLRSSQMHHSLLMRHHSSQMQSCSCPTSYRSPPGRRTSPAAGRTPTSCKSGAPSTSPGARCRQSLAPAWMQAAAAEGVEVGWCRHTGGTGTVAGTADTADTGASADSTLNKTCRKKTDNYKNNPLYEPTMFFFLLKTLKRLKGSSVAVNT